MLTSFMNDYSEETVRAFGKRSSLMMFSITSLFALFGAASSLAGMFSPVPLFGMAWIPLCFLVIPPIHFLCREFMRLQDRVKELERKLAQR